MNIKNNIMNYLLDKDYVICIYENYVYVFNYQNLDSFNDNNITLQLKHIKTTIKGTGLTIVKITKEEILIRGDIKAIEMIKNE